MTGFKLNMRILLFLLISSFSRELLSQPFIATTEEISGVRDSSIKWGDYDNDGDLDIILAGETV